MGLANWISGGLLAVLPLAGGGQEPASPVPPVRAATDASAGLEHFLLEWQAEVPPPRGDGPGDEDARRAGVLGLARLRRCESRGELRLELELDYLLEDLRLYAVERLGERGSRLVWREMATGWGRTVRAEWSRDGTALETAEWDQSGRRARSSSLEDGAVLPQYLLELARTGRVVSGPFQVFDPLAGRLERQELSTTYEAGPEERFLRVVRLRRGDGTLAGEYRFEGERLVGFRLQNGRIAARAVDEETYEDARGLFHAGAAAGTDPGSGDADS